MYGTRYLSSRFRNCFRISAVRRIRTFIAPVNCFSAWSIFYAERYCTRARAPISIENVHVAYRNTYVFNASGRKIVERASGGLCRFARRSYRRRLGRRNGPDSARGASVWNIARWSANVRTGVHIARYKYSLNLNRTRAFYRPETIDNVRWMTRRVAQCVHVSERGRLPNDRRVIIRRS